MSARRRIKFVALILSAAFCILSFACGTKPSETNRPEGPAWETLSAVSETPVRFATEFSITQYTGGFEMIEIPATGRLLIVPEGQGAPKGLPEDVQVIFRPVDRIYLTATSAMDFFRALDGIGSVRLSGTKADGWSNGAAKEAMERGDIVMALGTWVENLKPKTKKKNPTYEMQVGFIVPLGLIGYLLDLYSSDAVKSAVEQYQNADADVWEGD